MATCVYKLMHEFSISELGPAARRMVHDRISARSEPSPAVDAQTTVARIARSTPGAPKWLRCPKGRSLARPGNRFGTSEDLRAHPLPRARPIRETDGRGSCDRETRRLF